MITLSITHRCEQNVKAEGKRSFQLSMCPSRTKARKDDGHFDQSKTQLNQNDKWHSLKMSDSGLTRVAMILLSLETQLQTKH